MLRPTRASTCRSLHTTWDWGDPLSQLIDITTSTHPSALTLLLCLHPLFKQRRALRLSYLLTPHRLPSSCQPPSRVPTRLAPTL